MHSGGCSCGAIRFELDGQPSVCCLCHCEICRRSVGATPVAWATFARSAFRLLAGTPAWYSSSPAARRGFCALCGSSLLFESRDHPDEIDVTIVTLDRAGDLVPDRHIWVPSRVAWASLADGLPRHVADSGSARCP